MVEEAETPGAVPRLPCHRFVGPDGPDQQIEGDDATEKVNSAQV
jgi:hypothetical protein